jgi:hypothetical protein
VRTSLLVTPGNGTAHTIARDVSDLGGHVKFLEINLDGTAVRAMLNEEKAPKTCQAVWEALPFEGRAVHAQISGEMFRMLDETPVGELEIESRVTHQYPGAMVFFPPIKEIAFCIGEARFSGGVIPSTLTPLGDIEGDFSAFAAKGDALDRTGAKPIRFRRAADQTTPFRPQNFPSRQGRRLQIDFDGVTVGAVLLENLAPKTTQALASVLPLDTQATNDTWGGPVTRVWGSGSDGSLQLSVTELESAKHLVWPGYVYFDPRKKMLRVCYGIDADIKDVGGAIPVTPVAAIDRADVERFAAVARRQLTEGKKRIAVRLV